MVRRLLICTLSLTGAAALPSLAVAAPTTTMTAPATTPAPAPAPPAVKPASARIGLTVLGAFHVGRQQLTVIGKRVRVDGRVVPYVANERIAVRIWRGRKLVKQASVLPKPTRTGRTATFSVRYVSNHSGTVKVFALHAASAAQAAAEAHAARLSVVAPVAGPGTRGPFVALLQQRLAAIGYAVTHTGDYDAHTQRAVLAFRKVNGLPRLTTLSPTVVDRVLRGVGGFHVRFPREGRHVEANLGQQVLALIENGRVVRAYGTSSGKPSTPTVLGSFHFYSKTFGTNGEGMVDANYFIRGYAIHGYAEVPTYAASHGCLRVWIPDARPIFDWVHIGDRIDVYY